MTLSRLRNSSSRGARSGALMLALVLVLAQLLGVLHRLSHAPGAGVADHVIGAGAYWPHGASRAEKLDSPSHGDAEWAECRLFDQLLGGDLTADAHRTLLFIGPDSSPWGDVTLGVLALPAPSAQARDPPVLS